MIAVCHIENGLSRRGSWDKKSGNIMWLSSAAEVVDVLPDEGRLMLKDGELSYDSLIVATGATHHCFGRDQWAGPAPGLKTVEDALHMRRRILLAFEAAERETNPARR
jgi:NADH dehydrogenase